MPGSTPSHSTWAWGSCWYGCVFRPQCPGSGSEALCSTSCALLPPGGPWWGRGGLSVPRTGTVCWHVGILGPGSAVSLVCPALDWPGPTRSCQALVTALSCPGNHRKGQSPQMVTGPAAVVTSGFDGPARWGCQRGRGASVFLGTIHPFLLRDRNHSFVFTEHVLCSRSCSRKRRFGSKQIRPKSLPVGSSSPEGGRDRQ